MNNPKGIGIRLDPKQNSNTFWIKRLISFNRVSLASANDITIQ